MCAKARLTIILSRSKLILEAAGGGGGSYGESCLRMFWSLAEVNTCNAFSRFTSLWCTKFIFYELVKMKFCNEMW